MKIINPQMGFLFFLLLLVWLLWTIASRTRRRVRQRWIENPVLSRISRLSSERKPRLVLTFGSIALALLVAALIRPQIETTHRVAEYEKQDLIILLDRSLSMTAEDIPPSRFTRAKEEIRNFLLHKPEAIDRVALITFAGASLILSYPTRDIENILFYLDWIEEDERPQYGTDIGAAIESAMEIVRKDRSGNKKIYVLISDGEDHGSRVESNLQAMRREGAHIHAIGIGTPREVPIPIKIGTQLQELTTTFNETTLRWVAQSTGGLYFRSAIGNELSVAMNRAVNEELKIKAWATRREYRDIYQWLILSAVVAMALIVPIFQ